MATLAITIDLAEGPELTVDVSEGPVIKVDFGIYSSAVEVHTAETIDTSEDPVQIDVE